MANDNPTSPASSPEATQQAEVTCLIHEDAGNGTCKYCGGARPTQQAAEQASGRQAAPTVFAEISRERAAQDEQWGGYIHDDSHERDAWFNWIQKQNSYAFNNSDNPYEFEHRMVKVAALAVAAIESSRRQRGALPENDKASKGQNSTGSYAKELAETRGIAGALMKALEYCAYGEEAKAALARAKAAGISPESIPQRPEAALPPSE